MKSTCPTPPIFHLLALGVTQILAFALGDNANFSVRVRGNANFDVFRYQHVGISNVKLWRWGSKPTRGPNANGFASQWNMGFKRTCVHSKLFLKSEIRAIFLVFSVCFSNQKRLKNTEYVITFHLSVWTIVLILIIHIKICKLWSSSSDVKRGSG